MSREKSRFFAFYSRIRKVANGAAIACTRKITLHSFFSNAALQVVDLIQGGGAVEVGMDVGELKSLKRSGESVRSDDSTGRKIRRMTKALEDT